ncbi:hypothetical protein EKN06_07865 [Croceicoccus ponticola]|uniref:Uncharacterized protein n=1 Tax=Croceicoccus ponticola TaxID=2217664 RepID=A0A437GYR7_9SPHN|nr:hypothetical protein [Croceicoccus ponticola]RVQ67822.1 hypothetical protein EKN06_07865 [Croceicoccus ponticola]
MANSTALSRFFAMLNPLRAARDFRDVWVQENPYRWRIALVSLVATISVFSVMFQEEHRIEPRPPEITWITTLEPGRSDAEIVASNLANQREKERLAAERKAREEQAREVYEAIGRASGIDVEQARREGDAERAAAAAAEKAKRERALAEIEARQDGTRQAD